MDDPLFWILVLIACLGAVIVFYLGYTEADETKETRK